MTLIVLIVNIVLGLARRLAVSRAVVRAQDRSFDALRRAEIAWAPLPARLPAPPSGLPPDRHRTQMRPQFQHSDD